MHKQICMSFGLQTATLTPYEGIYLWEKYQTRYTSSNGAKIDHAQALVLAGIALRYQMITKEILHDHISTSQPHIWISSIVATWLVLMDRI